MQQCITDPQVPRPIYIYRDIDINVGFFLNPSDRSLANLSLVNNGFCIIHTIRPGGTEQLVSRSGLSLETRQQRHSRRTADAQQTHTAKANQNGIQAPSH